MTQKIVKFMQVMSKTHDSDTTFCDVFCIWQVLGCHMNAPRNDKMEKWPYFYPLVNGTGCSCYNYYGAYGIASCASNIRNHEVINEYEDGGGSGMTKVKCSHGNFVLGCGFKPRHKAGPEKWYHCRAFLT